MCHSPWKFRTSAASNATPQLALNDAEAILSPGIAASVAPVSHFSSSKSNCVENDWACCFDAIPPKAIPQLENAGGHAAVELSNPSSPFAPVPVLEACAQLVPPTCPLQSLSNVHVLNVGVGLAPTAVGRHEVPALVVQHTPTAKMIGVVTPHVGVGVTVGVLVTVAVSVGVRVCVAVLVTVAVGLRVIVGVAVAGWVPVTEAVGVAVTVTVNVTVCSAALFAPLPVLQQWLLPTAWLELSAAAGTALSPARKTSTSRYLTITT